MYVIYAQFLDLDPSLSRKVSASNNQLPEPGPRANAFGEFHSPGSHMDSELTPTVRHVDNIPLDAPRTQQNSQAIDAPSQSRQGLGETKSVGTRDPDIDRTPTRLWVH
jgi:hypothetical protein